VIHHGVVVINEDRVSAFTLRMIFRRRLTKHEAVVDREDGVAASPVGHEVLGMIREHGVDRPAARVPEAILHRSDGQAGIVGGPRNKGAPAGQLDIQRDLFIAQVDRRKGEARQELRLVEARQSPRSARSAIAGARAAEHLPVRHGTFEDFRDVAIVVPDADRREGERLVEELDLVAHGHVRDRAAPLQSDHARAHAPDREGDAIEIVAGVGAVVFMAAS
jgi:hypothetical protein